MPFGAYDAHHQSRPPTGSSRGFWFIVPRNRGKRVRGEEKQMKRHVYAAESSSSPGTRRRRSAVVKQHDSLLREALLYDLRGTRGAMKRKNKIYTCRVRVGNEADFARNVRPWSARSCTHAEGGGGDQVELARCTVNCERTNAEVLWLKIGRCIKFKSDEVFDSATGNYYSSWAESSLIL